MAKSKKQKTVNEMLTDLSEKVRLKRWDGRLTLSELAAAAKVSTVTISQLEQGKAENANLQKIVQIANAVGYNVTLSLEPIKK